MKDDIMYKIRRFILWLTPTGWTVRRLQQYSDEFRACGVLTKNNGGELQIHKLKPTYHDGIFLAYSVDEYNKEVNHEINDLKYQIRKLEEKLR